MEDYLTAIRDLELRIERAANFPQLERPNLAIEPGIPKDFEEHCRLLCDLIVLAIRSDVTRLVTFALLNEVSNRAYPEHGVREGHHDISHEGEPGYPKITLINRLHMRQMAYLLGKLKSVREGSGTLLDHCLIAYGSAFSDGRMHVGSDLPMMLAGKAGGTVQTGRHIRYPADTPISNLWLSMLERTDIRIPSFGNSTGSLNGL